jgi:hypothetical protein
MKTNQWVNPGEGFNTDGGTTFYNFNNGAALHWNDMEGYGIHIYDGGYGLKLFYESRGYTVSDMYNQYIDALGLTYGFTFAQYKAEIDAGRPVIIHVVGHTMLGYGYDDTSSDLMYIHDTWDYSSHTMIWGGSYYGMDHNGVTIVLLNAPASDPTIINVTNGSITQTEVGLEWSGSSPEFRVVRTTDGSATSPSNGTLIYEGSATSTTDTGLTSNTSYFYTVFGKSTGSSTYSSGNQYLCAVTEAASGATTASVPAGQTGEFTFGTTGSVVYITTNGSPAGTIASQKFDTAPTGNNTISGTATAPDASTVTPNVFSSERYWTISSTLGSNAFTVYFDISGLSGVNDPNKLLILKRDAAGWVAQNTLRDGNQLYSDITSFSDFIIGADSGDNPLPVTLSSFTAVYYNGTPIINWTTQSESNNSGWNIYRSSSSNAGQSQQINFELIPGAGTVSEPTEYSFIDEYETVVNQTYWYWLESISGSGETETFGPVSLTIPFEEENTPIIPVQTKLWQNYPNPFNPTTFIRFDVKENEVALLTIFNIKGQITLSQEFEAGRYDHDWDAGDYGSGIYLYKLQSPSYSHIKKMILVK